MQSGYFGALLSKQMTATSSYSEAKKNSVNLHMYAHCKFSDFSFTFIYIIFLVKNCTREFFREIATFSSKTLSFDIFFLTKKLKKKVLNFFLNCLITQLSLLDFHHLTIFFQRHESIGDLA